MKFLFMYADEILNLFFLKKFIEYYSDKFIYFVTT